MAVPAQSASELTGTVEGIIYQNEDNGYCVLNISPQSGAIVNDLGVLVPVSCVKVVGYIPGVRQGERYRFTGQWGAHPKYGEQFQAEGCEQLLPSNGQGVIRYLADVAYGIGPATARKIVEALGEDCLERIRDDPDCLRELDFVRPDAAEEIVKHLTRNRIQAELAALICREGITPRLAAKIYQEYGKDSIKVVKENPYILADEMWGVGFKTADRIAQSIGIAPDSPFRIKAAVDYLLREAANEGHCYLRPRDIMFRATKLLDGKSHVKAVAHAVEQLSEAGRVVREGDAIYPSFLYRVERGLASRVREFLERARNDVPGIDFLIRKVEKEEGIAYAPEQRQAIAEALCAPLSIITGGPGTGKSEITKAICCIYSTLHDGHHIHLASPTGRAAKRLSEVTGLEAKTIHRLLKARPTELKRGTGWEFEHDSERPLPGPGLVIVDEVSMCDICLTKNLFAALRPDLHRVLLVGDVDQLPSVGPGSVLRDLIACGLIPTTRLKFNYRQAGGSRIAEYANNLIGGQAPPAASDGDYEYVGVDDDVQAAEAVSDVVKSALADGLGPMDFQVLAPMYRGRCGVQALNLSIRDLVNPARKKSPELGRFRLHDKVMVTMNNYDLGVFNGNIGVVVDVDVGGRQLTVRIDDRDVLFCNEDLGQLTLAYAVTIHKSQGNEFPLVIMPILRHHFVMLQRNLLYTGMTRAKDRLVLISDGFGVRKATANDKVEKRNSLLAERIGCPVQARAPS